MPAIQRITNSLVLVCIVFSNVLCASSWLFVKCASTLPSADLSIGDRLKELRYLSDADWPTELSHLEELFRYYCCFLPIRQLLECQRHYFAIGPKNSP